MVFCDACCNIVLNNHSGLSVFQMLLSSTGYCSLECANILFAILLFKITRVDRCSTRPEKEIETDGYHQVFCAFDHCCCVACTGIQGHSSWCRCKPNFTGKIFLGISFILYFGNSACKSCGPVEFID